MSGITGAMVQRAFKETLQHDYMDLNILVALLIAKSIEEQLEAKHLATPPTIQDCPR